MRPILESRLRLIQIFLEPFYLNVLLIEKRNTVQGRYLVSLNCLRVYRGIYIDVSNDFD